MSDFKCCGRADLPCTSFEASCRNPANYGDCDFCPKCKREGFVFCATPGCPEFIRPQRLDELRQAVVEAAQGVCGLGSAEDFAALKEAVRSYEHAIEWGIGR